MCLKHEDLHSYRVSDGTVIVYKVVQLGINGKIFTTWGPKKQSYMGRIRLDVNGNPIISMHANEAIPVRKVRKFKPLSDRKGVCGFLSMDNARSYQHVFNRRFPNVKTFIIPYRVPKGRKYIKGVIGSPAMCSGMNAVRAEQLVMLEA